MRIGGSADMRKTAAVGVILFLAACASDDVAVPEECVGVYKLPIEKKTYLLKPGGGSAPEYCRDHAISLEEHLEKKKSTLRREENAIFSV